MDIVINIQPIQDFFSLSGAEMLTRIIFIFGWIPVVLLIIWGLKQIWVNNIIQAIWAMKQKYVFLAIDVPRGNMQSPRAVENLFNYLAGAHGSLNLIEKYWEGKFQLSFSLEIVSIDGYTQFIIRTPVGFRQLVEAAIYAQYPDAEINEINDYTTDMPSRFPDEEWDVWGAEFIQAKNQVFPIKTYPEFEHDFGKPEDKYRDPMAALMDLCSSLHKGEQLWFQIIIQPIDFKWIEDAEKVVSKLIGEKPPAKPDIADRILNIMSAGSEIVYSAWGDVKPKEEKKEDQFKMMNLKPNTKKQMDSIYMKVSKIGFNTKIRMAYLAKRELMNKGKVVNGFVGFMKQFASLDLNNLKPDTEITATGTSYFWKESRLNTRKNKLVRHYKDRDGYAGRTPGVLNVEELATIWHFPVDSAVKAPMIQKAPGRKAEPPMGLPIGESNVSMNAPFPQKAITSDYLFDLTPKNKQTKSEEKAEDDVPVVVKKTVNFDLEDKGAPPSNLPFA
jgi:hypothetical protein